MITPKTLVAIASLVTGMSAFADEMADQKACLNQIREIAMLSQEFAQLNDGRLPKDFAEMQSIQKNPDRSLLVAPVAKDKTKPSYELVLPGKRLATIAQPNRTVVIRSLYRLQNGQRLVAFADGHIEFAE